MPLPARCSSWACRLRRAKIGTFLDQVVNVFYVTDQQDRKIRDDRRLDEIRVRLLEVVEEKAESAKEEGET